MRKRKLAVVILVVVWIFPLFSIPVSQTEEKPEVTEEVHSDAAVAEAYSYAATATADLLGNPSMSEFGLEEFVEAEDSHLAERGKDYMLFSKPAPCLYPPRDTESLFVLDQNQYMPSKDSGVFVTAPTWILDPVDGVYRPFIYNQLTDNEYQIATAGIGARFVDGIVEYYDPDVSELLAVEAFEAQYLFEGERWTDIPLHFDHYEPSVLEEQEITITSIFDSGTPLSGIGNVEIKYESSSNGLKHTISIRQTAKQEYEFRIIQKWSQVSHPDFIRPIDAHVNIVDSNPVYIEEIDRVTFLSGEGLVMCQDTTDDSNPVLYKSYSHESVWIEDEPTISSNGSLISTGHYEDQLIEYIEPSPFMEFFTRTSMNISKQENKQYEITFIYQNHWNFTVKPGEYLRLDPTTTTYSPYDTDQNGWIYSRDDGYKAYNKGYYGSSYFPFGYYDPEPGETGYEYFYRSFEQFNVQGLPDDADVKSVVLATYMQEVSYDDDVDQQRLALLREVENDWGTFNVADWYQEVNTDWSLVINHGECEKTESGEYRRWASWNDWEGGPLCNLVESKSASDYVRLRYSHILDEFASDPTPSEFNLFTKEYQRNRNGGPDPSHSNTLIVSYSISQWDYTYDGTTNAPADQPSWLVFPRELFEYDTTHVYDGEIGPVNDILDVVEWGTNPGGGVYWGPHIILPWPKAMSLDISFEIGGKFWFDNDGTGTAGNELMLWDTNNKLIAYLYIYDLWAYSTTSVVKGRIYDEDGSHIRSIDLKPQSSQAVDWNGVSWSIRSDSARFMMQFHDVDETILGTISEMGSNREIGYFSYRMWQRDNYGVCNDPGGIDEIHFKTPNTENVLYDDCSSPQSWELRPSYHKRCRYPIREPSVGVLDSDDNGGDYFYFVSNISSGMEQHGPFFRKDIPTAFKLSSLFRYQVELERILTQVDAKGELHISLYETLTNPLLGSDLVEKPIIDIVLKDYSTGNNKMNILARYYDDILEKTELVLDSAVTMDWHGKITLWYDGGTGLWVDYSLDSQGPLLLASLNVLNPDRIIGLATFQMTCDGSSPIPNFRIYDIQVEKTISYNDEFNMSDSRALRSAPKDNLLQRPGPSTEVQLFPAVGDGKLSFLFYSPSISYTFLIDLDIRPIWLVDLNALPYVNVAVDSTPLTSQQLSWDPIENYPTYNYILSWQTNQLGLGWHEIEIDVRGASWSSKDLIALRGIWVYWGMGQGYFDVYQHFTTEKTLTYLVPLGKDATLGLDWIGDDESQLTISVDGVDLVLTIQGPQLYTDLILNQFGDYSRNTLHILEVKYNGIFGENPWDTYLKVMHVHYFWMNIEVDHVDGYYPTYVNFAGIKEYYESNTHLRINYFVTSSQESIPDLYGSTYTRNEIVRLGQIDGYFDHRSDRYWLWCVYLNVEDINQTRITLGLFFNSDNAYTSDKDPNGWNRWIGTCSDIFVFYENLITVHEWGHAMHCHEGYEELCCLCLSCVYHQDVLPTATGICQYHWFETFENVPNHIGHLWVSKWWGQ